MSVLQFQTKFSRPLVLDLSNAPHPLSATLEAQVNASIASSLQSLRYSDDEASAYVNSLLLGSPNPTLGRLLQHNTLFSSHVLCRIADLRISNGSLWTLQRLYDKGKAKPKYVQCRFYPESRYEVESSCFCREKDIVC